MTFRQWCSMVLMSAVVAGNVLVMPVAHADRCWFDRNGYRHCDNGKHKGHYKHFNRDGSRYYDTYRRSWFDTKTGKIVKGGLVGAGIGLGTGVLLDKDLKKTTILGGAVGAGVQAVRYSNWLEKRD